MTMVKVICSFCGKKFEKSLKNYNLVIKHSRGRSYCSKDCWTESKKKEKCQVKCSNCGKEKTLSLHMIEMSKTKRFFCDNSCAASFNNKGRTHSDVTKRKISQSLSEGKSPYKKNCSICGKEFRTSHEKLTCSIKCYNIHRWGFTHHDSFLFRKECLVCRKEFRTHREKTVTCSRQCSDVYRFGFLPLTKEEFLSKLLELSQQLRATPSIRQAYHLIRASRRFFGKWNEAVKAAGLVPNLQRIPKKRLNCTDGHIVDSFSERTIDEWLSKNNIEHVPQKQYPEGFFRCDFYLPKQDIWIEYWGMLTVRTYREGAEHKKMLARKYGLRLLEITPDDLYPEPKLDERLVVIECL